MRCKARIDRTALRKLPNITHPADGRHLERLLQRVWRLNDAGVYIPSRERQALKRIVDILLFDERAALRISGPEELPKDFGKFTDETQSSD